MRKFTPTLLLALLVSVSAVALAQDPPPGVIFPPPDPDFMKWDTFGNGDDEFHSRFPKRPSVFLTRRDLNELTGPNTGRIYAAYDEGVVCIVAVFDNPKKVPPLDQFISEIRTRFFPSWEMKFDYEIQVNNDLGKHFLLKRRTSVGAARFFVKSKHSYMFAAVAVDDKNPGVKRFMEFITMWAYPLEKMRTPAGGPTGVDVRTWQTATVVENSARDSDPQPKPTPEEEQLLPGIKSISTPKTNATGSQDNAPSNNPLPSDEQIFESDQVTTRAVVVLKPEAVYTEEARNNTIEGVVSLSGVLTRDGRVKDISVVQGLPYGLTESAVNAMKHLIFLPARKDDHYVAQKITLDYTFAFK